jgi:hypothetical protein
MQDIDTIEYQAGYAGAQRWRAKGSAHPYPLADTAYRRGWNAALAGDIEQPGYAMFRFRAPDDETLPGYGRLTGLRCFMFTTAAVYASDRATAEAFADANQLRGPLAREYHAELS